VNGTLFRSGREGPSKYVSTLDLGGRGRRLKNCFANGTLFRKHRTLNLTTKIKHAARGAALSPPCGSKARRVVFASWRVKTLKPGKVKCKDAWQACKDAKDGRS